MTAEPKWPTHQDAVNAADLGESIAQHMLRLCREAFARWQADDPSKSPVGEVRRGPNGRLFYRKWRGDQASQCWSSVIGGNGFDRLNDEVRGWEVIGQVPGTPAAEVKS